MFKQAFKDYFVFEGKELMYLKNEPKKIRARCAEEGCPWLVLCSHNSQSLCFQIKTFIGEHNCGRNLSSNMVDRAWVTTVREQTIGNEREQYGKLHDYLNEIHRRNPSSIGMIDVTPQPEGRPLFNRLYISLDACKKGFKAGCRPLIRLNGCFLKGYFGGHLLLAGGQDANNSFFVIAFAIVEAKNTDFWKWFLSILHDDLGPVAANGGWLRLCIRLDEYTSLRATSGRQSGLRMKPEYYLKSRDTKHNLQRQTCACNVWQLTGLPYKHAVAAISRLRKQQLKPEDFAHKWLTIEAVRATYGDSIKSVNSEEFWEKTNRLRLEVPIIKRPPRKPTKKRAVDVVAESQMPPKGHKVRKSFQVTCSKCAQKGHYYRTCKGAPANPNWQPKRKKAGEGVQPNNPQNVIATPLDPAKAKKQKKKVPKRSTPISIQEEARVDIQSSQSTPPPTETYADVFG
ncbi:uncharacterized protein [Arachis hypogaea]|uniref:uncharacterized protein n=1 Tax=Arachis hypogaea TaxID=3818 RepID=UPI003B20FF98